MAKQPETSKFAYGEGDNLVVEDPAASEELKLLDELEVAEAELLQAELDLIDWAEKQ